MARSSNLAGAAGLLHMLRGGDRRSIGKSNEVVAFVLAEPRRISELIGGMLEADPLVQMRSADAVEKVSAKRPALLQPYAKLLTWDIADSKQSEVRWHVAQMLPRLKLSGKDRERALRVLREYLNDPSAIVRTFALQGLADFAQQFPAIREEVLQLIRRSVKTGTPAMKSRGRKLLKQMEGLRQRSDPALPDR